MLELAAAIKRRGGLKKPDRVRGWAPAGARAEMPAKREAAGKPAMER